MKTLLIILCFLPVVALSNTKALINEKAIKYGLDPILVEAIFTIESQLNNKAVNKRTLDYGIGQLNYKILKHYNISAEAILESEYLSITVATRHLLWFKRRYGHEKMWFARYNCGTGSLDKKACKVYFTKVVKQYNQLKESYAKASNNGAVNRRIRTTASK